MISGERARRLVGGARRRVTAVSGAADLRRLADRLDVVEAAILENRALERALAPVLERLEDDVASAAEAAVGPRPQRPAPQD